MSGQVFQLLQSVTSLNQPCRPKLFLFHQQRFLSNLIYHLTPLFQLLFCWALCRSFFLQLMLHQPISHTLFLTFLPSWLLCRSSAISLFWFLKRGKSVSLLIFVRSTVLSRRNCSEKGQRLKDLGMLAGRLVLEGWMNWSPREGTWRRLVARLCRAALCLYFSQQCVL